nr:hypothetical protein [uncultured Oscillibacter sp.]
MRKRIVCSLLCLLLLAGCGADAAPAPEKSKLDAVPFQEGQLYAAAYLGYQEMEDLPFYAENYLDGEDPPVHYFSDGDYYLIIPRYPNTAVALYRLNIETTGAELVYEDASCGPFILQCNVSDIVSDAEIRLTYQGETVSFSPYISLADGSVQVGERGLDITQ